MQYVTLHENTILYIRVKEKDNYFNYATKYLHY